MIAILHSFFFLFPSHIKPRLHINIRSEEHTSELQSQSNLVCRLLLEKKKVETIPSPLNTRQNSLSAFSTFRTPPVTRLAPCISSPGAHLHTPTLRTAARHPLYPPRA